MIDKELIHQAAEDIDIFEADLTEEYERLKGLNSRPLQHEKGQKRHVRWGWAIAAAACLFIAFLLWPENQNTPQNLAEVPDEQVEVKEDIAPQEPKETPFLAQVEKKQPAKVKIHQAKEAESTVETSCTEEPVNLATTADSLAYYLAKLENQMGDCRDSTCLAHLSNLIKADDRIKGLVNKIINKQVETAYKEEYLVDTTTHYIPL